MPGFGCYGHTCMGGRGFLERKDIAYQSYIYTHIYQQDIEFDRGLGHSSRLTLTKYERSLSISLSLNMIRFCWISTYLRQDEELDFLVLKS